MCQVSLSNGDIIEHCILKIEIDNLDIPQLWPTANSEVVATSNNTFDFQTHDELNHYTSSVSVLNLHLSFVGGQLPNLTAQCSIFNLHFPMFDANIPNTSDFIAQRACFMQMFICSALKQLQCSMCDC